MTIIYQHISCEERAVIIINDRQGIKAADTVRVLGQQSFNDNARTKSSVQGAILHYKSSSTPPAKESIESQTAQAFE